MIQKAWVRPHPPRPPPATHRARPLPALPPPRLPPPPSRLQPSTSRLPPSHLSPDPPFARLPHISSSAGATPVRLRSAAELEEELGVWRRACADAHAVLSSSGPLRPQRGFQKKAIKVVAHTMRLLLRLGHLSAAKELDRAFFSTSGATPASAYEPSGSRQRGRAAVKEGFSFGDGLGLRRGGVYIAWIYSLALRLEPTAYGDLEAFGALLGELGQSPEALRNPVLVAFLVRKAELVSQRGEVEEGDEDDRGALAELVLAVKKSKRFRGEEFVLKAVVEAELVRQEEQPVQAGYFETEAYARLEASIKELVEELDQEKASPATTDTSSPPSKLPSSPAPPTAVERRAHTLHLAIRFLLLRAKSSAALSSPEDRYTMATHSISASLTLYTALLALHPLAPPQLERIRERQTAALYRVVWSTLGTFDAETQEEHLPEMKTRGRDESTLPADLVVLEQGFSVIESTLAHLSTLHTSFSPSSATRNPSLLGISSRFWRRVLYALTLPSCPSRRPPSRPPPIRPPWPVLARTLSLILRTTAHDQAVLASSPPTALRKEKLFIRRSILIHLLRSTLLGGMNPVAEWEETVQARLETLLGFFDELGTMGEEVNKAVVRSAIEVILSREFVGEVWGRWRRDLRLIVARWDEEGSETLAGAATDASTEVAAALDTISTPLPPPEVATCPPPPTPSPSTPTPDLSPSPTPFDPPPPPSSHDHSPPPCPPLSPSPEASYPRSHDTYK